ncbi:conserved hypothetical protein [Trichinella spiralis]|uniref:hypothetical protein n=1 Tax=Trichinella spiralis TaxID=6334 RepID=UPI0001EFD940|nr:conserved hypothetical protein [Trichinella spiralis]
MHLPILFFHGKLVIVMNNKNQAPCYTITVATLLLRYIHLWLSSELKIFVLLTWGLNRCFGSTALKRLLLIMSSFALSVGCRKIGCSHTGQITLNRYYAIKQYYFSNVKPSFADYAYYD